MLFMHMLAFLIGPPGIPFRKSCVVVRACDIAVFSILPRVT